MRARVELLLPNTSIVVCSRSSSTLSKFWRLLLRLLEAAAASTVVSRRGEGNLCCCFFFLESKVKGPRYTSAPGTSLSVGSKRRLHQHHMEETTDGRPRCENRCRGWMWPHHHHHRRPKALLTRSLSHYHYVWFSQFWSHFRGTMHCLHQRLKSTLFEIFLNGAEWEKISNNDDFSLWGT